LLAKTCKNLRFCDLGCEAQGAAVADKAGHARRREEANAFCALCARKHNDVGKGWFKARSKHWRTDVTTHVAGADHQRARDQVQARWQMGRFDKTLALGQVGRLDQDGRSAQDRREQLHGKAMTSRPVIDGLRVLNEHHVVSVIA
jgi:hypothetical protein